MIDPRLAASTVTFPRVAPKTTMAPDLRTQPDFKAHLETQPPQTLRISQPPAETRSERIARFEKPRVGLPITPFTAPAAALTLAEAQDSPWLVNPASGPNPAHSGPTLADAVDIMNPLQHIPFVGQVYRGVTGDEISGPARFIGGTIYGGPIGGALAMVDVALKDKTGHSFSEAVVARMDGAPAQATSDTRDFSLMVSGLVNDDQADRPYIS